MGLFDGLKNIFGDTNTANQTVSRKTGTTVGQQYTFAAPQYQPVRPAKPQHKAAAPSSSNTGAANWFNGIGSSSASTKNDNLTVYSLKGNPLRLTTADCKASGGEGTVYALPGKPNVLVKIYKDDLLQNPAKRAEIEKRIYDMLAISKDMDQTSFAWPRAVVCNNRKQVIGFAMNKCTGISFQAFSGVRSIQQHFPRWTRLELAKTALDFLTKLQYLASKKIFVNDFNPANFLVDQKGRVSFIDCDSYQVPGAGNSIDITKTYFASHVAPELLENPSLLAKPRTIHHVEFGAALTVFSILMCGLHPYSYFDPSHQSACGTPDENLRKGRCPLARLENCMFPRGDWKKLWSHLTYNMKGAFIATFADGHQNPSKRTTLPALSDCLTQLIITMQKDPERCSLTPKEKKTDEYKGKSSSGNQKFSMNF